jgi:DNA-binding Lrp family transcriptional regulator
MGKSYLWLNTIKIIWLMRREIISKSRIDRRLDETDIKIINLMILNKNNKEISSVLKIPLSTVQRRVRHLISSDYLASNVQINYQKFGFKTGLVHVYLEDGNIDEIAKKVQNLDLITYVEIHIGNSDILGNVVYKEGKELLNLFSDIKKMKGVERIVWSERIYQSPSKESENIINILNSQKKVIP